MKVVIFAGGFGTRLGEYTDQIPKPMVDICGRPMLTHLMDIFSSQGFNEFIISTGYKSNVIKQFFKDEIDRKATHRFDFNGGVINSTYDASTTKWDVTIMDTGLHSMTAGRLLGVKELVKNERFLCTYGDGLANVNLRKLLDTHNLGQSVATLTAVHPKPRFGLLDLCETGSRVSAFNEKKITRKDWVNGGFFVFEPEIFDYIPSFETVLERSPLETLADDGLLGAYRHTGYWECCDTKRDLDQLRIDGMQYLPPWLDHEE